MSPKSSVRRGALEELQPEGLTDHADATWQERKRSDFRVVVLEAVIDCLAEHGYAKTTTELVAAKARVPRGTMLHWFPNRLALIEATIDYAFFRRMENFLDKLAELTEEERVTLNLGIQVSWRQYFTKEYRAYLELHIAARTDPELRVVFFPRAKRYDAVWRREVARAMPEWSKDMETLDRAGEFVRATLEGLALNSDVWDDTGHQETLIAFVSKLALAIREKELTFPKKARQRAVRSRPAPKRRAKP